MTETIPEDLMQVARHVASYVRNNADAEAVENIVARVLIYQRTRQEARPDMEALAEAAFKAGRSRSSFAQEAESAYDEIADAARAALGNGGGDDR
ncbi:MAG: hypothetical protein M9939_00960 [Mesorhizobium sp.]|nr:hypothetical protein [Mesorhizobium sp.]MCO5159678.1 hypothetical protein [Mesorhizobium sp.]